MFDTLKDLKAAKVSYQIEKVIKDEITTDAKLTWDEYDKLTGVKLHREEVMPLDELKAHKANLEARLAAINEAFEVLEPKETEMVKGS